MGIQRSLSLSEQVMIEIRNLIYSGKLKPEKLHSAAELSESLEVSRSPVREALLRLSEVGLVEFKRNRGFEVMLPSPEDIVEIFALRLAVEPAASAYAAARASDAERRTLQDHLDGLHASARDADHEEFRQRDRELHEYLLSLARNRRATELISSLHQVTQVLSGGMFEASRPLSEIAQEHGAIVSAIIDGDADRARSEMFEHIEFTGRLLLQRECARLGNGVDPEAIWANQAYIFVRGGLNSVS